MPMVRPGAWNFLGRRSKPDFVRSALRVVVALSRGDGGGGLVGFEVVAVANDDGRADE
jgi:hypothetical protein